MSSFILMISFFTRIPFGKYVNYTEERYIKGLIAFPLVGLVIGAFLAIPSFFITTHSSLKGIVVILIYVMITGGIHLDGLADSCDGLFSNRPKERVLEIMKDSHIGAFGVIALILYFLSFYTSASELSWKWMLLTPFVGKTLAYFSAGFSKYARSNQGMGYIFITNIKHWHSTLYIVFASGLVFLLVGHFGLIAIFAAIVSTFFIMMTTKRVIGGQTGDTIGMIIETGQIVFMLTGNIMCTWGTLWG